MSARMDCQCGAIVGLFFDQVMVERCVEHDVYAEYHYPAGSLGTCVFYRNSLQIKGDQLTQFLVNSAATRPDTQARCDVGTEGGAPRGVAAGRAAEAIERYHALPDNP